MPLVNLSLRNHWAPEDIKKINDAVHSALVEAFKIPEDDYNHRTNLYSKEAWVLPEHRSEKFVLIEILVFAGRSQRAKQALYHLISRNLSELGVPKKDSIVLLHEPSMENWGLGGIAANQMKFSFKIDV
ncbi:MAG: tautomerase family protein [Spirochaetales bacterium]|nr:tautomerase family protein [Spirochaetales bacterium]